MFSLGAMIYLVARVAPRVSDVESAHESTLHAKLDKWIAKIPLDRIDMMVSVVLEKLLRKFKLALMKWDNLASEHIERLKKITSNSNFGKKEEKSSLFAEEKNKEE